MPKVIEEQTVNNEDFKFKESALDLLDDLEGQISKLMLYYAGQYAAEMPETESGKVITREDMKNILKQVIQALKEDEFSAE